MGRTFVGAAAAAAVALSLTSCGSDGSAEKDADTRASQTAPASETASAGQSAAPTRESGSARAGATRYSLTFRVTGTGSASVTVGAPGDTDLREVELPFEETVETDLAVGDAMSVSAATVDPDVELTCQVLYQGDTVEEETDDGACVALFTPLRN